METREVDIQTQAVAVPQRDRTIKGFLTGDEFKRQVGAALPTHLKPERFIRVAITALTRTPKLHDCTPESFFKCLLDLSAMGLEPDGRRAHLIPYGNQCTLIVDYKGIVELVRRSGEISYIHCDVVYDGDDFAYEYGSGAFLRHRPDLEGKRERKKATYSFVKMRDGSEDFIVWSMGQVEAIKARSKASGSGPWKTDFDEMAKKSVFRNHSKWLPFSPELREKIEHDDDTVAIDADFSIEGPTGSKEAQAEIAKNKLSQLGKSKEAKAAAQDLKESPKQEPPAPVAPPEPTAPEETTQPEPQEPKTLADQLMVYEEKIGVDSFARILKNHNVKEAPDVTDKNFTAIMADMEDIVKSIQDSKREAPKPPPPLVFGRKPGNK